MNKTIAYVKPQSRPWTSSYGPMVSIDGGFDDGEGWSINCKPENEEKLKATLEGLVNKPLDGFTVEPAIDKKTNRQREFQGRLQWSLKQPQAAGGFKGVGKSWTESYAQSRECKEIEQRSIQRAVALERAIQYGIAFGHIKDEAVSPQSILAYADEFFLWLSCGEKKPEPTSDGTSDLYKQFLIWCDEKVRAHVFIDKATVWKAAMTYANQLKHDHQSLQRCTDQSVFRTIKDKLISPTNPRNGNVVDDDSPF